MVGKTTEEVAAGIAAGEISFLFDGNNKFVRNHARVYRNANSAERD